MKIIIAFLLSIVCVSNIAAQQFRYEAKLDAVDSTGFYKIYFAPSVNAKVHQGYIDLRLFDASGKETSYLLTTEEAFKTNQKFVNYEITESKIMTDSVTVITLRNKLKSKIDNISLRIKNAEVRKQIKVSGSDDRMHWYVVKDYAEFNSVNNTNDVSEIKLIDFPLSNYEFYRIEINDKYSKPLNILNAGYDESVTTQAAYTEIKPYNTFYTDSVRTKTTWVRIPFIDTVLVDLVIIDVESPKYFLRSVDIYNVLSYKNGKPELQFLKAFEIKSGAENKIIFRPTTAHEFVLCVHNEDNPSLKFAAIKYYQLNRYALAYLEKLNTYTLRFGNDSMSPPSYDLKYFQNIIPADVPVIKTGEVVKMKQPIIVTPKVPYTLFTDKKFIWIAIAIVIVFLGIITFRMLKEK